MKKNAIKDAPLVQNNDITIRTKNVMTALNIKTLRELYTCFILDTIPKVGTTVKFFPHDEKVALVYSNKVNDEVKELLRTYYSITNEEFEAIGK